MFAVWGFHNVFVIAVDPESVKVKTYSTGMGKGGREGGRKRRERMIDVLPHDSNRHSLPERCPNHQGRTCITSLVRGWYNTYI